MATTTKPTVKLPDFETEFSAGIDQILGKQPVSAVGDFEVEFSRGIDEILKQPSPATIQIDSGDLVEKLEEARRKVRIEKERLMQNLDQIMRERPPESPDIAPSPSTTAISSPLVSQMSEKIKKLDIIDAEIERALILQDRNQLQAAVNMFRNQLTTKADKILLPILGRAAGPIGAAIASGLTALSDIRESQIKKDIINELKNNPDKVPDAYKQYALALWANQTTKPGLGAKVGLIAGNIIPYATQYAALQNAFGTPIAKMLGVDGSVEFFDKFREMIVRGGAIALLNPGTIADVVAKTADIKLALDTENGKQVLRVVEEQGQPLAKLILETVGENFLEYTTEQFGELTLPFWNKFEEIGIKLAGKSIKNPESAKAIGAAITGIAGLLGGKYGSNTLGRLASQVGWHGIVNEIAEEFWNALGYEVLLGRKDALRAFFENFIPMTLAFLPYSMVGGAGSMMSLLAANNMMKIEATALGDIKDIEMREITKTIGDIPEGITRRALEFKTQLEAQDRDLTPEEKAIVSSIETNKDNPLVLAQILGLKVLEPNEPKSVKMWEVAITGDKGSVSHLFAKQEDAELFKNRFWKIAEKLQYEQTLRWQTQKPVEQVIEEKPAETPPAETPPAETPPFEFTTNKQREIARSFIKKEFTRLETMALTPDEKIALEQLKPLVGQLNDDQALIQAINIVSEINPKITTTVQSAGLITPAQRAKIFVSAKEIGLDEDKLHNLVQEITNKSSIKELTIREASNVIRALEARKEGKAPPTEQVIEEVRPITADDLIPLITQTLNQKGALTFSELTNEILLTGNEVIKKQSGSTLIRALNKTLNQLINEGKIKYDAKALMYLPPAAQITVPTQQVNWIEEVSNLLESGALTRQEIVKQLAEKTGNSEDIVIHEVSGAIGALKKANKIVMMPDGKYSKPAGAGIREVEAKTAGAEAPPPPTAGSPITTPAPEVITEEPVRKQPSKPAEETPKPAKPYPNRRIEGIISDKIIVAYTAQNTPVELQAAIMEGSSLMPSHTFSPDGTGMWTPGYPQELQPRHRTRIASEMQVRNMALKLNPELLGITPFTNSGAPIIGDDGIVESGNGRASAILLAYEMNNAEEYRKFVISQAAALGLDTDAVQKMAQPVLVRVRKVMEKTIDERADIAVEMGQDVGLTYSAGETALQDAKIIMKNNVVEAWITDGRQAYISAFVNFLPNQERNTLFDNKGRISRLGVTRAINAILAAAYEDWNIVVQLTESLADESRNLRLVLEEIAPHIVMLKTKIAMGEAYSEFDIAPVIINAVNQYWQQIMDGVPKALATRQISMFDPLFIMDIKKTISDYIRKPRVLVEIFQDYFRRAMEAPSPKQYNMFEEYKPDAPALFRLAIKSITGGEYETEQPTEELRTRRGRKKGRGTKIETLRRGGEEVEGRGGETPGEVLGDISRIGGREGIDILPKIKETGLDGLTFSLENELITAEEARLIFDIIQSFGGENVKLLQNTVFLTWDESKSEEYTDRLAQIIDRKDAEKIMEERIDANAYVQCIGKYQFVVFMQPLSIEGKEHERSVDVIQHELAHLKLYAISREDINNLLNSILPIGQDILNKFKEEMKQNPKEENELRDYIEKIELRIYIEKIVARLEGYDWLNVPKRIRDFINSYLAPELEKNEEARLSYLVSAILYENYNGNFGDKLPQAIKEALVFRAQCNPEFRKQLWSLSNVKKLTEETVGEYPKPIEQLPKVPEYINPIKAVEATTKYIQANPPINIVDVFEKEMPSTFLTKIKKHIISLWKFAPRNVIQLAHWITGEKGPFANIAKLLQFAAETTARLEIEAANRYHIALLQFLLKNNVEFAPELKFYVKHWEHLSLLERHYQETGNIDEALENLPSDLKEKFNKFIKQKSLAKLQKFRRDMIDVIDKRVPVFFYGAPITVKFEGDEKMISGRTGRRIPEIKIPLAQVLQLYATLQDQDRRKVYFEEADKHGFSVRFGEYKYPFIMNRAALEKFLDLSNFENIPKGAAEFVTNVIKIIDDFAPKILVVAAKAGDTKLIRDIRRRINAGFLYFPTERYMEAVINEFEDTRNLNDILNMGLKFDKVTVRSLQHLRERGTITTYPVNIRGIDVILGRAIAQFSAYIGKRYALKQIRGAIKNPEFRGAVEGIKYGELWLSNFEEALRLFELPPSGGGGDVSAVIRLLRSNIIPGVMGLKPWIMLIQPVSYFAARSLFNKWEVKASFNPEKIKKLTNPDQYLLDFYPFCGRLYQRYYGTHSLQYITEVLLGMSDEARSRFNKIKNKIMRIQGLPNRFADELAIASIVYDIYEGRVLQNKAEGQVESEVESRKYAAQRAMEIIDRTQMSWDPLSTSLLAIQGRASVPELLMATFASEIFKSSSEIQNAYNSMKLGQINKVDFLNRVWHLAILNAVLVEMARTLGRFPFVLLGAVLAGRGIKEAIKAMFRRRPAAMSALYALFSILSRPFGVVGGVLFDLLTSPLISKTMGRSASPKSEDPVTETILTIGENVANLTGSMRVILDPDKTATQKKISAESAIKSAFKLVANTIALSTGIAAPGVEMMVRETFIGGKLSDKLREAINRAKEIRQQYKRIYVREGSGVANDYWDKQRDFLYEYWQLTGKQLTKPTREEIWRGEKRKRKQEELEPEERLIRGAPGK